MPNPLSLEGVTLHPHAPTPHLLTPDAVRFVCLLHRTFNHRRLALLSSRQTTKPTPCQLLRETQNIRAHPDWRCPVGEHGWPHTTCTPRPWHLDEPHMHVDGQAVSATLYDFALHHHHQRNRNRGNTPPHYTLHGLQHHLEAQLWRDVLRVAEDVGRVTRGTLHCTLHVDSAHALWQLEEMLFHLRAHCTAVAAGPSDTQAVRRLREVCARRGARVEAPPANNPATVQAAPLAAEGAAHPQFVAVQLLARPAGRL